jgi:flagellin
VGISLGKNIPALNAVTALDETSRKLSNTFERLSSGLRINSAADDSAALALATRVSSDSQIAAVGARNVSDGISALSIAESAITEITSITARIKELATEASNESYSSAQRTALDSEAQALADEFERIVSTTSYNGRLLLDGTFSGVSIQPGSGTAISLSISSLQNLSGGNILTATGTFTASGVSYGAALINGALGDLDGDGDLDQFGLGVNTAYVLLNNGNGTCCLAPGASRHDVEAMQSSNSTITEPKGRAEKGYCFSQPLASKSLRINSFWKVLYRNICSLIHETAGN